MKGFAVWSMLRLGWHVLFMTTAISLALVLMLHHETHGEGAVNLCPELQVESVRIVVNDGAHNAFTDLCRFKGRFYLTFRSCPEGHMVFSSSRIRIMTSEDAQSWSEVYSFHVEDRDVRDPHFLCFRDRLFVYTGTWLCDPARPGHRELNEHLGYGVCSEDGQAWEGPRLLEGTYGHYIWRAACFGDRAYLCGRRKKAFAHGGGPGEEAKQLIQSVMLESVDGWIWKTAAFFTEEYGDETAFLFDQDGCLQAVVRGPGSEAAQFCTSKPPYQEWERSSLGRYIGGPLLVKWGSHHLVGGRKLVPGKGPVTALYWLVDRSLVEAAELPSGGDTSYPGFVALDEHSALLSYYSSHEGSGSGEPPSAIYLAELRKK